MSVTIELTKGFITTVDATDSDLGEYNWFYVRGYAVRDVDLPRIDGKRRRKRKYLHNIILERIIERSLNKDELCDHINRDSLDNRRNNLRRSNRLQNNLNRLVQSNSSSGFKGVFPNSKVDKWEARIGVNGKSIYLGLFDTPEEACEVYCEAAKKYHGGFNPVVK